MTRPVPKDCYRIRDLVERTGICRSIWYEHLNEYVQTDGESGLRSYKIRGRAGRKGSRLIKREDYEAYLPTMLVDVKSV